MKKVKVKVRISFTDVSEDDLPHIHRAEKELGKAGIHFDTGYDMKENRRDWEFDDVTKTDVFLPHH